MNTDREKTGGMQAENALERKLLWDEENRLEAIDDNGFVSNYWYDAAGERTVKTSGESEQMYVNSLFSGGNTGTANFTAYVNPYLVVSRGGQYTKHIYIGSQRIVSKLGDLESYGADPRRIEYAGTGVAGSDIDYGEKYRASGQTIRDRYAKFGVPYFGEDNNDYVGGGVFGDRAASALARAIAENDNPEIYQYYYHADHLGSSSLITNLDGETVQHIEYVPFGEVFIEERNDVWNTPYLFNAKELDSETGLYYYGARYYDPRTSVWLSTDPSQENYPNISTYAYAAQNPVKFIDADGEEPILPFVGTVKGFVEFMNNLSTGIGTTTGSAAHEAMLRMGKTKGLKPANTAPFNTSGNNRYIYTEKGGWIDMAHFIFYAGRAYMYKQQKQEAQQLVDSKGFAFLEPEVQIYYLKQAGMNSVGEAVQEGYKQEFADQFTAPYSAYSYEDLPSDKFGAEFGAQYFDPNSKLTFSEQIENYLNDVLKSTSPETAPNYNNLPNEYPEKKPTIQNKTTNPLFTTE